MRNTSKRLVSLLTGVVCSLVMVSGACAADYKITTLDWPPYTGEKLPAMGMSSAVVSEAMKAAGHNAKIEFHSWTRAVNLVTSDDAYTAFFPAYYTKERAAKYLYSDPIGTVQLVFVERKAAPITWTTYDSLKGKKIGVVKDYANTEELDAKIANKTLTADVAPDDVKSLLKLAAGRLDVAVIDVNVFNSLAKSDASVKAVADQLQVNAKPLESKQLFLCFKKSPEGEVALKAFNQGLKKINIEDVMNKAAK